ncbi:UPF0235 protein C15orf40 homolog [Euwallacea fornicatus]|uniref:UPF0235 protein C15orf40 homolog n=1 Tax=Euwallacea fornicatus TaxID=995702 RepID=UPI00338D6DE2
MFKKTWYVILVTRFYSYKSDKMPKKSKCKCDKEASASSNAKTNTPKGPIKLDSNKNILIQIHAKPGAKQNTITDVSDDGIGIQINAPPVEGSANIELVKFIASFLGLKSSAVCLERGHKSRNKVLRVTGIITLSEIVKKFNNELPPESKIPEDV